MCLGQGGSILLIKGQSSCEVYLQNNCLEVSNDPEDLISGFKCLELRLELNCAGTERFGPFDVFYEAPYHLCDFTAGTVYW